MHRTSLKMTLFIFSIVNFQSIELLAQTDPRFCSSDFRYVIKGKSPLFSRSNKYHVFYKNPDESTWVPIKKLKGATFESDGENLKLYLSTKKGVFVSHEFAFDVTDRFYSENQGFETGYTIFNSLNDRILSLGGRSWKYLGLKFCTNYKELYMVYFDKSKVEIGRIKVLFHSFK